MSEQALKGKATPLAGQVALVTGAARRIGRDIALALAEAGAAVAVNYKGSAEDAEKTVADIKSAGSKAAAIQADVSRKAEVEALVRATEAKLGPVDILVNNAGIFGPGPWNEVTEEDWDRFMNANLKAQFLCAQAVAPGMKQRGRGKIVNLASLGGLLVWSGFIPYCVSKAGVIHLTRLLARALGPEIQVNAVAPGTIQFPDETADESYARRAPLRRTGKGEDIAQTVLFLCTGPGFITGQIVAVDGGYSLI